ncbi:AAA family ATPase [Thomasclavelia cocleata]|uniref:AAA family ATPase n=1 Tax=Thomasclavelia cocleata TaxID=69824 RepID=UPI00242CB81B|nr:AAA family ATPase [Thomasclavelia cocleata]
MGLAVLVLGSSGSGKSTSLRNFEKEDVLILNVAGKALPFRKKLNNLDLRQCNGSERYSVIKQKLSKYQKKCKTFVIDDSQYLMAFQMFDKAKEVGYGKFTDIAVEFKGLLDFIADLDKDVIVYLLHHTDTTDNGHVKAKTSGKMIDSQLTMEGLFTIVLMARNNDGVYKFLTQGDGLNPVKTPMEMFEDTEIDNDLKIVDKTIREYYEMGGKE